MKKLIGARKERVDAMAREYLAYKALADKALADLKEECKNETECATGAFKISFKTTSTRRFSKQLFIDKYGKEAYEECLAPSSERRFRLTKG